jgi:hypothetical protein
MAAPMEDVDLGRVTFRALGDADPDAIGDHGVDRLVSAVAGAGARVHLELRKSGSGGWLPVADVVLGERLDLDDRKTWFSPFTSGRGIAPVGFIAGLRRMAYMGSRLGRGV